MKKISVILLFLFSFAFLSMAPQTDAAKKKKHDDIRNLIEMTTDAKSLKQIALKSLVNANPDLSQEKIQEKFGQIKIELFYSMLVPAYDKNYSQKEISELLKFYTSPIGKKMLEKQKTLALASSKAVQKWLSQYGALPKNK